MRYLLIAAVAAVSTGGYAQAAGPTMESACIRAAAAMSVAPSVIADVVQSFAELNPPRVKIRFRISDKPDSPIAFLTCKFRKNTAPFGLTELCNPTACLNATSTSDKGRALYEEVSTLLKREGL